MIALRVLWAAPWALVSYALAWAWCVVGWGRVGVINNTRVITTRGPVAGWFFRRGWAGVTIGVHVWSWGVPRPSFVAHEAEHVRQWSRWGPLFPVVYLALLALRGYQKHPMEIAAREAAQRGEP